MQKLSSDFIEGSCAVVISTKNAKTVLNAFIEIVNESKGKLNKLYIDQKKKKKKKRSLDDNDILMHSAHNEGKSVVAERFIRILKGKIYKKMKHNASNFILVI